MQILLKAKVMINLIKRYNINCMDDLYALVGVGAIVCIIHYL